MINYKKLDFLNKLRNKNIFEKYKKELIIVFNNIKKTISNNKDFKSIFQKYYKGEQITASDNLKIKNLLVDNLKLVGLGGLSIASFPIPGGSILILFIIRGAKKLGINLLPSEFTLKESVNADYIDITKMLDRDWVELQLNIIEDCFPNTRLEIIPVKLSRNKSSSASFNASILDGILQNKHFNFNKNINWTKEKLENVMAHEMIHYYLAAKGMYKEGHGIYFKTQMDRINSLGKYKVTLKDDEFILTDEIGNKNGLYLYVFNNGSHFVSSSNIDLLENKKILNNVKKYFPDTPVYIYQITKQIESSYGFSNMRKIRLMSFKDKSLLLKIINDNNLQKIKEYN